MCQFWPELSSMSKLRVGLVAIKPYYYMYVASDQRFYYSLSGEYDS